MGILGWEGSSFDLVAELFSPGMREGVLKHGRGDALRAEAGVFVPNSRAPLPLELSSTNNNSSSNANGNGDRAAPRTHQEGLSFIEAQLEQNANRPLFSNTAAIPEQVQYPNVYTSTSGTATTSYGGRLALPMGTIRKEKEVRDVFSTFLKGYLVADDRVDVGDISTRKKWSSHLPTPSHPRPLKGSSTLPNSVPWRPAVSQGIRP